MRAIRFGRFQLDFTRRELSSGGSRVELGGRAFDILCVMAAANGETVSKDALMAQVWPDRVVEENNIEVHISALRKALRERDQSRDFIAA